MLKNRVWILPAACLFVFFVSLRAAEPLPSKLSDAAFWKMIGDFSEEGGYFRFENFLSNELGFQMVIPGLQEKTKPGGVYLGVGPEQNFTYIAALQPKIAFIIDIRRQNMLELMMYRAFFELSPDRADFLSRLFARKRPAHLDAKSTPEELFASYDGVQADPLLFKKNLDDVKNLLVKEHKFALSDEDLSGIEYVYRVFMESGPDLDYQVGGGFGGGGGSPTYMDLMTMTDGEGKNRSYLGTEDNYRAIRDMEMKNLIVPLVGDFGGPKAIRTVAQYLKDHDAKVTAFYLSNVEQYLFQDGAWRRFYGNVATLPVDSSSQFIRTINGGQVRGRFRGGGIGGMRFVTLLSPIDDVIDGFQAGQVRTYNDVIALSHQ
jgi:hypothetical protein